MPSRRPGGSPRRTLLDSAWGIHSAEPQNWSEWGKRGRFAAGTLYAGGPSVGAYAVDDGTREWHFEGDAAFWRVVGTTDETVFVSGRNERLYGLAAATGEKRWTYSGPHYPPAIGGERAFVAMADSVFAVPIDAESG